MISASTKPRLSRSRRREAMINVIARLIGCTAVIVMVAAVFRVMILKLWEGPKVDPDLVEAVFENQASRKWSGSADQPHGGSNSRRQNDTTLIPGAQPPATRLTAPAAESQSAVTGKPVYGLTDIEAKRPKIAEAVRQFFAARNVTEKAAYARDVERVRPLMDQYYQTHSFPEMKWQTLGWVLPVAEPGYRLGYAQALFENIEPVSLIVEELSDSSFRVDWESSVRYGDLPWQDFLKLKPAQPKLLRVVASKPASDPPGLPLGNEVLELKHPGETGTLYAYFNRDDPQFSTLIQQLELGKWKDVPLTLRLCFPGPNEDARKVQIAGVEGKGWLILENRRS